MPGFGPRVVLPFASCDFCAQVWPVVFVMFVISFALLLAVDCASLTVPSREIVMFLRLPSWSSVNVWESCGDEGVLALIFLFLIR